MTASNWIRAASLSSLACDEPTEVVVEGRELALYRLAQGVFATDNRCTHGDARLSDGFLMDCCIECPLHQGQFDIRTGAALCEPVTEPIRVYPVRIDADDVMIDFAGSEQ